MRSSFNPVLTLFILLYSWILSQSLTPLNPLLALLSLSCCVLTAAYQGLLISWENPPEEFGAD